MKKLWFMSLITVVIFFTVGLAGSTETEKAAEAKKLFEKKCSACHGIKKVTSVQKTAEEWNATVQRMKKKKNSSITDEEAKIITEYLSENYKKNK